MPGKTTVDKAKEDLREGKSPSTAAGEFVHEEIEHVHRGKHGARSPKQAIAIGLNKARRAGIPLKPPAPGRTSARTRKSAESAYRTGQNSPGKRSSSRRSQAREKALKRERGTTTSHQALSKQARDTARRRRRPAASASSASGRRHNKKTA